ncbi:L-lactate dehydrogenase complex protein LldE [Actinokineospora alba]|uniref:L-lactate dehydrogenase complex protein LldE n=1 Tax=Actinokineospora alba TaxID=504798 RepID=A0A1H0ESN2_9PSEU|nr:(Fe-S)-binding protein [Actinokineospora alba]TDP69210.1 L-lactate dehydrogenase complex protein LldE [Actinokineospora alba]SDI21806.1 L-lactate dehydrogenase complex protein LldE [Actinokineospora alba]SDN85414.1 L-lactate dehydrogenase complex protein LldE [Actinokineospora alba]
MRVALFITCFNDTLFPATGQAVVRVLERLGHEVVFPPDQTCCGQMHFNTGYQRECVPLVRSFVDTFADADVVVAPSASCVGMVRDFHSRVAEVSGDRGLAAAVAGTVPRVHEFTEFLVDIAGVTDVGAYFPHRVTYHPTCHGLRLLKLGDRPRALLRAVEGIELVDLPGATECCGFGGTFAVKNSDVSVAMGTDKVARVLSTGAEVLTAADNSCLMHVGGLLSRSKSKVRVMHLAEILAGERA